MAIIGAMLGMANATSGDDSEMEDAVCLRGGLAGSAVVACFGTRTTQAGIAFLAATFLCQIVFGIYAMILRVAAARRQSGVAHA